MVPSSNAGSGERAMVIMDFYSCPSLLTMEAPWRSQDVASLTYFQFDQIAIRISGLNVIIVIPINLHGSFWNNSRVHRSNVN